MKRLIAVATIVSATTFGLGGTAFAHEPACNGLNRAHENTHDRGDEPGHQAEDRHHDLRHENDCTHQ